MWLKGALTGSAVERSLRSVHERGNVTLMGKDLNSKDLGGSDVDMNREKYLKMIEIFQNL